MCRLSLLAFVTLTAWSSTSAQTLPPKAPGLRTDPELEPAKTPSAEEIFFIEPDLPALRPAVPSGRIPLPAPASPSKPHPAAPPPKPEPPAPEKRAEISTPLPPKSKPAPAPTPAPSEPVQLAPSKELPSTIQASIKTPLLLVDHQGAGTVASADLSWSPLSSKGNGPMRLSISCDTPGAGKSNVEAALWTAALAASWQSGGQVRSGEIKAKIGYPFTGASGNAAFALAILSLWKGHSWPASTALSAAVLPDGTLAPVGHLDAKIEAARLAGIRRIFIASSQSRHRDRTGFRLGDPVKASRKMGVDLIPADNLDDILELAQGRVGSDTASSNSLPSYPPQLAQSLSESTAALLDAFEKVRREEAVAAAKSRPAARAALENAERLAEDAQRALREQMPFAAWQQASEASAALDAVKRLAQVGVIDEAACLKWLDSSVKLRRVLRADAFSASQTQAGLGHAVLMSVDAARFLRLNARLLRAELLLRDTMERLSKANPDELKKGSGERDFHALTLLHAAFVAQAARQQPKVAEIVTLPPAPASPDAPLARSWASAMTQGQLAQAEFFRTSATQALPVTRESLLRDDGLTLLLDLSRLASLQLGRARASTSTGARPPEVDKDNPIPRDLPASVEALYWITPFTEAAALDTAYFLLGATRDEDGQLRLSNDQVLEELILQAYASARKAASKLTTTSYAIPIALLMESASWEERQRDPQPRIHALRDLWKITLTARFVATLSSL